MSIITTIVSPYGVKEEGLRDYLASHFGEDKYLFTIIVQKNDFIQTIEKIAKTHQAYSRNNIPNRFIVVGPLKENEYKEISPFSDGILYWSLDAKHKHPVNSSACLILSVPEETFDFKPVVFSWKRPASEMDFKDREPKKESKWDTGNEEKRSISERVSFEKISPLPDFIEIPKTPENERDMLSLTPSKIWVNSEKDIQSKFLFSINSSIIRGNIDFFEITDIMKQDTWQRPSAKFVKVFENRVYFSFKTKIVPYSYQERCSKNYKSIFINNQVCAYWDKETCSVMY